MCVRPRWIHDYNDTFPDRPAPPPLPWAIRARDNDAYHILILAPKAVKSHGA
jgi:hypothetical protein